MNTAPVPFTVRFDELQRREMQDAEAVADAAAIWQERARPDSIRPRERHALIARATAYLRGHYRAWQDFALSRAVRAVDQAIASGDVGALFCRMSPEARHAIAAELARAAIGSYIGALEGTAAITPGEYLKIQEQIGEDR